MFGFFKKNKTPAKWENLSNTQKTMVTRKIIKALSSGPHYKLVSGSDVMQRGRGYTETKTEDEILTVYGRGSMIDLARNATRNSSTFNAILKQFDFNAVGQSGGKVIIDSEDGDELTDRFAEWTRNSDFFDGVDLNSVLKLILKTYLLGGDMALLFDDGIVEDSGKILVYEPDEIGNTTTEALISHYGVNASQSQGRVYNPNGRFIGAIVSRSQRGKDTFDADKSYFLMRDPDASMFDSFWMMPRNVFRFSQGRGTPPLASSLATILDLEDLCSFEIAAAKKNAQTLAQVLQSPSSTTEDEPLPSAFDSGTDFSGMTDDEIDEAAKMEMMSQSQTMTLDKVRAAGCIYQVMPENYKMELLDTKHPNQQIPEFISWLAGRATAPFGLTRQFATLQPDGASFRADQLMSWRAFLEAQKFLEKICDWIFWRWTLWASKRNVITPCDISIMHHVSWAFPTMDELDESLHQDAVAKKLKNLTSSYKDELGPDWKEKLLSIRDEIDWFKKNNLPHPAFAMLSGGERTGVDRQSSSNA